MRIVVVDESPEFVNRLAAILEKAGHEAFTAIGRDAAIRTFERLREHVDLAIIDFLVPGTTGPELIGFVKQRLPGTRVIATVPGEDPDLSGLAAQTPADMVIRRSKKGEPPDRARWIRAIDEILRQRREPAA